MSDKDKYVEISADRVAEAARALAESGVTPVKIDYIPVSDPYGEEINALIVHYSVRNLDTGTVDEDAILHLPHYAVIDLFYRLIGKAFAMIKKLRETDSPVKWIAVPCPDALLWATDAGERIREITQGDRAIRGVRVLFSGSALATPEAFRALMSELGNEGIASVVGGFGEKDFPMLDLTEIAPDALIMTGLIDKLNDRNKAAGVRAVIDCGKAAGAEIIATGVGNDAQVRELRVADVFGIIPSEDYDGAFGFVKGRIGLAELFGLGREDRP